MLSRRKQWRRLANVAFALLLSLAVATPLLTPPVRAHATMPPGACTPEEDGNRIGYNGVWYECRCTRIPGTTVWACNWVQVSKNAIQANANYDYVSTELGYGGSYYAMLRARAVSIGP